MRAKVSFEEVDGRESIIVSEIPYQVNKADMIKKTADLVNDKKIELCQALYSGDSIKFGKNQPEFIIYLERSLLKTKNSPRVNQARPKSYFLKLVCKLKSG